LVGLFSMLDAILDIELATIVKEFTLDKSITDALLMQTGLLGDCLLLTKAIETKNWPMVETQLKLVNPEIEIEKVYSFILESMLYSDDVIEVMSE